MNNNLKPQITDHPYFRGMKANHLALLSERAREVRFKAGEIIFHEGEPANQFYLVESGKVALVAHEPSATDLPIQVVNPGEVLGWSWLFPPFVWHLQARAVEPTRLIALDGAHLLITAERDPEFGYDLMKRVAQVVIHRLQATRKQLCQELFHCSVEG